MRRDQIAEWFLSLFVPADQAASIVGDLAEDPRRSFWFWSSIIRTATAHLVSDFTEYPLLMFRAGWVGYLTTAIFPLFLVISLLVAVILLPHTPEHSLGQPLMVNTASSGPPNMEPMLPIRWGMNVLWAFWLFQCGRWVARKMPSLEIASSIAVAATGWMAVLAWAVWLLLRTSGVHVALTGLAWHDVPLIAGAIAQRKRRFAYGS